MAFVVTGSAHLIGGPRCGDLILVISSAKAYRYTNHEAGLVHWYTQDVEHADLFVYRGCEELPKGLAPEGSQP